MSSTKTNEKAVGRNNGDTSRGASNIPVRTVDLVSAQSTIVTGGNRLQSSDAGNVGKPGISSKEGSDGTNSSRNRPRDVQASAPSEPATISRQENNRSFEQSIIQNSLNTREQSLAKAREAKKQKELEKQKKNNVQENISEKEEDTNDMADNPKSSGDNSVPASDTGVHNDIGDDVPDSGNDNELDNSVDNNENPLADKSRRKRLFQQLEELFDPEPDRYPARKKSKAADGTAKPKPQGPTLTSAATDQVHNIVRLVVATGLVSLVSVGLEKLKETYSGQAGDRLKNPSGFHPKDWVKE